VDRLLSLVRQPERPLANLSRRLERHPREVRRLHLVLGGVPESRGSSLGSGQRQSLKKLSHPQRLSRHV